LIESCYVNMVIGVVETAYTTKFCVFGITFEVLT